MSFDVFTQAFRNGDSAPANAEAARAILSQVRHIHEPEHDFYGVEFPDGSHLEIYAAGLDGRESFTGVMFALRGTSEPIGNFIFEFTRASGCVLLPAMDPPCILLTDEAQERHLPPNLLENFQIIPISNGSELLAALEGGLDTWRAYRDRVIGGSSDTSSDIT
ncbi:MAG TPA: hypothetical protein VGH19_07055 [Verrucomicrobiae bacterium]